MPYKKGSLAEQLGKLRRTTKRRIASLEKAAQNAESPKEANMFQMQISKLREEVARSYQRDPLTHRATGYTQDELRIARQNLTRYNAESRIATGTERRNFITQQELNNPGLGEFTPLEVRTFYKATQEAWEGAPSTADRNKLILDHYGETDLREFVRSILKATSEQVREAEAAAPEYSDEDALPDTSDQTKSSYTRDMKVYLAKVNQINRGRWEQIKGEQGEEE